MNFRFSIFDSRLPAAPTPPNGARCHSHRCNGTGEARTARLSKSPGGFTLIELLIVIAIIAILAALTLNTAGYIQKKAARSRAETEIAALSAALESYKADHGDYPPAADDTNATVILRTNLSPSTGKVYFEFSKNMGTDGDQIDTDGPIIDPFGENYHYVYPGDPDRSGTNFFDLWSQAAAGDTKSNQWIKNW